MKSSNHFLYVAILSIFLTAPLTSNAAVMITEVMYDLDGADIDWVEVYNPDSTEINLTSLKLLISNSTSNHGINNYAGSTSLASGAYGVIVNSSVINNFISKWGSAGNIFTASFTLPNTEGKVEINNGDKNYPIDSVSYSESLGAKGDGNSLHRSGNSFVGGTPTPGVFGSSPETSNPPSSPSNSSSYSSAPSSPAQTSTITARAGKDQTTFVGAGSIFEGEALGTQGSPLQNARYVWNFGDGIVAEGKSVMHTYLYPGTYIAVLSVASGEYSASDRLTVTVVSPEVSLAIEVDGSLVVRNASSQEIDLGVWMLTAGGAMFTIPRGTIVLPGGSVRFAPSILGFSGDTNATLLGPNGTVAARAQENKSSVPEGIVVAASKTKTVAVTELATLPETPRVSEDVVGEDLVAAPASRNFSLPLWGYLVGLAALLGLGVVGSLYARLPKEQAGGTKSTADEFEISG